MWQFWNRVQQNKCRNYVKSRTTASVTNHWDVDMQCRVCLKKQINEEREFWDGENSLLKPNGSQFHEGFLLRMDLWGTNKARVNCNTSSKLWNDKRNGDNLKPRRRCYPPALSENVKKKTLAPQLSLCYFVSIVLDCDRHLTYSRIFLKCARSLELASF